MGYANATAEEDFEDWFDGTLAERLEELDPQPRVRLQVLHSLEEDEVSGPPTTDDGRALLANAKRRFRNVLGRGALLLLEPEIERAVGWAERHHAPDKLPFAAFVNVAVRRTWLRFLGEGRFTRRTLAREVDDERARDAAARAPSALNDYANHWRRRLVRLQRTHRGRWTVRGSDDEDVREQIVLDLIEHVLSRRRRFPERAGAEASYIVACRCVDRQRTLAERTEAAAYAAGELVRVAADVPSVEDKFNNAYDEHVLHEFMLDAARRLTGPQRVYFLAMSKLAHDGDELTAAELARVLGKNRSSATRMIAVIAEKLARAGGRGMLATDDVASAAPLVVGTRSAGVPPIPRVTSTVAREYRFVAANDATPRSAAAAVATSRESTPDES